MGQAEQTENTAERWKALETTPLLGLIGNAGCGKDSLIEAAIASGGGKLVSFGDQIRHFFAAYTLEQETGAALVERIIAEGQVGASRAPRFGSAETFERAIEKFVTEVLIPFEAHGKQISCFTQDRSEKALVRPVLEHGGDLISPLSTARHFALVDMALERGERVFNARIGRVHEAEMMRDRGGVIVEVRRPGCHPASAWEEASIRHVREAGLVDVVLMNAGDLAAWQAIGTRLGQRWADRQDRGRGGGA